MTSDQGIYANLKHYFGFDKFKGDQLQVIQNILKGNDTFVLMPTGGGKSLCYQLPAVMMEGTAIVVSPLIALMKNQVDAMRSLAEEDSLAHFMNSTLTKQELTDVQNDVLQGRTKLLYVAPETLTKPANATFFSHMNISFYAVDEAHCISEWGHDFRVEYRRIRPSINVITMLKAGIAEEDIDSFLSLDANVRSTLLGNKFAIGDFQMMAIAFNKDYDEEAWRKSFADIFSSSNTEGKPATYSVNSMKKHLDSCVISNEAVPINESAKKVLQLLSSILEATAKRPPVIALTATATEKVGLDIKKSLGILHAEEYKSSFNRSNLYYEVRQKTKNVDKDILKFISSRPRKSGIIYCLSRKEVERLAQVLIANNIKAAPYHAGLEPQERSKTQDDFLMERIKVIVATIAFGMGIDKPDVRFVIHYDIPKSLEGYYQETGRAGRDGGEGCCLAFYSRKDLEKLKKFMEDKPISEQDIGRQLLKETETYAESSVCRRKLLLHYFGEEYTEDNCHNCDNCKNPKTKVEVKDQLCNLIEIISNVKENFAEDVIMDIVLGKETDIVLDNKFDNLELFAIGENSDSNLWQSIIRQAILSEYIEKDIENSGTLKLTAKGKKFLKKPTSFTVSIDSDFDEDDADVEQATESEPVDKVLYQMLQDLREKVAKEANKPPYVIFQDPSLQAMATTYPVTCDELLNIPGVGAGKAKKYGKEFCALIKKHCEENEIDRPEDFRYRTVANGSKLRIKIIQNIDRKVDLDDFAEANRMGFSELLNEIDSIVYSGTKINIDYFLYAVIEEDKIDEICDYFNEAETDDIDKAINELGDDFSEEEIRLVRIKYLSDNAN